MASAIAGISKRMGRVFGIWRRRARREHRTGSAHKALADVPRAGSARGDGKADVEAGRFGNGFRSATTPSLRACAIDRYARVRRETGIRLR
ncbi:hypothetical protein [Salinisphaera orenii]|uniref:hypothetical protein n=1 Tax=Salinisphaera orenii TaxID=856731 RepID=UPI0011CE7AE9|nr:hypothetical protein [Salinisphaera halophila]